MLVHYLLHIHIPNYTVNHKVYSDCNSTYISVKILKMLLIFITHHVRIVVIELCFSLSGHHISCCCNIIMLSAVIGMSQYTCDVDKINYKDFFMVVERKKNFI